MGALEDDVRHAKANEDARERAADQLRPVFSKTLAQLLEIKEEQIPAAREAIKEMMKARERREERKNQAISETIRYMLVAVLSAIGTWAYAQLHGGK